MLLCEKCFGTFDEEEVKKRYYYDEHGSIEESVCPFCGSDEILEGRKCRRCEKVKPIMDDYMIIDDICDDCVDKIQNMAAELLKNGFGDEWYKYIYEMYKSDNLLKEE